MAFGLDREGGVCDEESWGKIPCPREVGFPGELPERIVDFMEYSAEELLGPLNEVEKKNAPDRLFVAGDRRLLDLGARVSIVGSRKASPPALKDAWLASQYLARHGVVIVSGLADGIDTEAHGAAIESGGRTIAVLGTPLDKAYPAENRALQERIAREHLVVSQFASGTPTTPSSFPLRNRTMALLADATLIIDADEKSGTQHQGWEALRLGRPLFFLERLATEKNLSWVQKMRGYGAEVVALDGLDFLREFLPERNSAEAASLPF
jgi:DNA processing protein